MELSIAKEKEERLPALVIEELQTISNLIQEQNWHGAIFGIKDGYEIIVKYICLCLCAGMEHEGDDSYCVKLLAPDKALSFGDWVNDILSVARKSSFVVNRPTLHKFLKKLAAFYGNSHIVSWRNETLGHGLMNSTIDQLVQKEIEEKAVALFSFLNKVTWPEELTPDKAPMQLEPFIVQEKNQIFLFESLDRKGIVRYLDCGNRKRVIRNDQLFWEEKQRKYYDTLNVADKVKFTDEIYLSNQDKILDGFHLTKHYIEPEYLISWTRNCLEKYTEGAFLIQGARNTGKSSFVYACDDLSGHGEQRIQLDEDTTVRAYYCSRMDISQSNDFKTHLEDILRQSPDGQQLRSRGEDFPGLEDHTIFQVLSFYQEQYTGIFGTEKLLLFVDGIDELAVENMNILEGLFSGDKIPGGIYLIFTCRSELQEIPPNIIDFIQRFSFTDRILFKREEENEQLLKKYLMERYDLEETESGRLAKAMDDRFHVLPLLEYFSKEEILACAEADQETLQLEQLAERYLQKLQLRYGNLIFNQFLDVLLMIAEETEPLTIGEISVLTGIGGISGRLLCFLKDASPFLKEYRSYRGNVYVIEQELLQRWLKEKYPEKVAYLAIQWELEFLGIKKGRQYTLREYELDGFLYMASNLSTIYAKGGIKANKEILTSLQGLCYSINQNHKIHQIVRAIHGMETIIATIEQDIKAGNCESTYMEMLLLTAQHIIRLYFIIRRFDVCHLMIERIDGCVKNYPADLWENPANRINLAILYSEIMIHYAEQNDAEKAREYYDRAMETVETIQDCEPVLQEKADAIKKGLLHNLIGVFRNRDYGVIEEPVQRLYGITQNSQHNYDDVGDLLMVAMAYKSAGNFQKAEDVLREACDWLADLETSGCPRNDEIYASVYWRLCQSINERYKWDKVTFTEIRIAIAIMDEWIQGAIFSDLQGFPMMMRWKADFMTTAALLRGTLAAILCQWGCWPSRFQKVKEEALKAVEIIQQLYQNMDKAGHQYDRVSAMFNLMNCGCIYTEFGLYEEAKSLIEDTLRRLQPRNEAERAVHNILQNKWKEIEEHRRQMGMP